MKLAKRILTAALALMLIFAMAAPSFAIVSGNQPSNGGNSYYVQTNLSDYYVNGQITVKLHVTTFKYSANSNFIDRVYNVTVGTPGVSNQLITVKQVLDKADQDNSDIAFHITSPYIGQNGTYEYFLDGIQDTTPNTWYNAAILYKSSTAYPCSYMFRINGMIPYYYPSGSTTSIGCLISDAYVTAGDTIDLYYATAQNQTWGTRVEYVRQVSNKTFQLLDAQCYKPSNQIDWTLTQWTPVYTDDYVDIYIDGVLTTVYVDENGQFTRNSLTAGTHTFRPYTYCSQFATTPNGSTKYYVPYEVGMYTEYVVN